MTTLDGAHSRAVPLITHRRALAHAPAGSLETQASVEVDVDSIRPLDPQGNRRGVDAWLDDEVVFELALLPMEDQVDPGVHVPVSHTGECADIGPPLSRVCANEVVYPRCPRFLAFNGRRPRSPLDPEREPGHGRKWKDSRLSRSWSAPPP